MRVLVSASGTRVESACHRRHDGGLARAGDWPSRHVYLQSISSLLFILS